ncbi:MAG: phage holin family protein [Saprospiraceae bacterium]
MENRTLKDFYNEMTELIIKYINSYIVLFKLEITEKLVKLGSSIVSVFIILIFFFSIFLLLSFSLAFWLGSLFGSLSLGFLASAGIDLVLLAILILLKTH